MLILALTTLFKHLLQIVVIQPSHCILAENAISLDEILFKKHFDIMLITSLFCLYVVQTSTILRPFTFQTFLLPFSQMFHKQSVEQQTSGTALSEIQTNRNKNVIFSLSYWCFCNYINCFSNLVFYLFIFD